MKPERKGTSSSFSPPSSLSMSGGRPFVRSNFKRKNGMTKSTLDLARARLKAYVQKDRTAIEALLADDYHFSSPIDNELDRATYLRRCWPNSEKTSSFDEVIATEDGSRAVIVYEAAAAGGHRF